jgi:valyl-tRNA synthetase
VLPYITEEIWSWAFAAATGEPSIHRAPWPDAPDFAGVEAPADPASFAAAVACFAALNKGKSEGGVSVGRGVRHLKIAASPATLGRLEAVVADVMAAGRVETYDLVARPGLDDGVFAVADIEFVEALEA